MTTFQLQINSANLADIDAVLGILDEAASLIIQNKLPSVWKPGEFSRQASREQNAGVRCGICDHT